MSDVDDTRLDDYRQLRDPAARRSLEGDEFFIAEGPVAIERLLASTHQVRSILLTQQKYDRLAPLVEPAEAPVYVVERDLLRRLVGFDLHRGAIAAADRRPHLTIAELAARGHRLVVAEGLNDPENLGAIARSARALGADGLVCDPTCIDPYTRRTVRVSMGEILHLATARAREWPDALTELAAAGFETWALTPADGAEDIWARPVPDRLALVVGAEGPGLSAAALAAAPHRVRIPIAADVDSLNVGAAAAAALAITGRPR